MVGKVLKVSPQDSHFSLQSNTNLGSAVKEFCRCNEVKVTDLLTLKNEQYLGLCQWDQCNRISPEKHKKEAEE